MSENTQTILYIEDDPANQKLVAKLLKAGGYSVLLADNGIDGIDTARQALPDLILMDMNMPGLDGYEASTRIKSISELAHIPLVAVTANVVDGDKERSLVAGCDGYLTKPIDVDDFVRQVETYLRGKVENIDKHKEADYLREYNKKVVLRLEEKVRQLSKSLDQAIEVSKFKSDFLSVISHEFRTPLNAIINFSEFLKRDLTDKISDKNKDWLDGIVHSGHDLLDMVKSILEYTAIESGDAKLRCQPTSMADVIVAVLRKNDRIISRKGLSVETTIDDELPVIIADTEKLILLINNIIVNAVKFTEQGKIYIECKQYCPEVTDGSIPTSTRGHIITSVSDTGIGMDEQDAGRINKQINQGDGSATRKYGGIGLGLAIAHRIVDMHKGNLWFESAKGKGTTFYIVLPIEQAGGQ